MTLDPQHRGILKIMELNQNNLQAACAALGFVPPGPALEGLYAYLALLLKWNKAMNLVGPQSWLEILNTLAADSFFLAEFLNSLPLPQEPQIWDLGAGAGLPGIPLRLIWTKGRYTLVEAREKRALFLQNALANCGVPGTKVFRGRAEAFMAQAEPADLILSRAFMPWQKLLDFITPGLKQGGLAVFMMLERLPRVLPARWLAAGQLEYHLPAPDGKKLRRNFWALRRG